jgi:hypothetical protein
MYLFGDVHELVKDCPKDLMLTPHSTTAYPDDGEVPNNLEFVQAGHINGGIVYVKKSSETVAALEWLVQQTKCKWFVAPRSGMYGDQQWLSLFPIFFNDITHVSMNPAVNIAYWNLHGRRLSEQSDRFLVNDGLPALLFHFSGFNIPSGGMLSKHSNRRFDDTTESVIAKLVPMYENLLLQSRQHYKTLGLIAEFKFATTPLGIRMSQASKLWDFNSVYIDDTKGFFARAGRYLDRMIFSI